MGKICSKPKHRDILTRKIPSQVNTPTFKSQEFFTFNENQINLSEVLYAGYVGDPQVILQYYQKGFDLNKPLNLSGWRLLHVAAQTGNRVMSEILISHGADVNAIEFTENWTPLMMAVLNNQIEIVRILLKNHADPLLRDREGNTAVDLAKSYHQLEIFNFLSAKFRVNLQ